MIIDDKHKIAFVHIPKCAGTTLRQHLKEYDRSQGAFTARVDMHDKLGMLDYVHIPLFVLKEHFPEEFQLVQQYWSFAVIRDPYSRFASSVSQRLKMYGSKPIEALSVKEIRQEVDSCIEFLKKSAREQVLLPHDYIHFQRQTDYIYLGKEKIVDAVYTTKNVGDLVALLTEKMWHTPENLIKVKNNEKRKNSTVVYRNDFLRFLMRVMSPFNRTLNSVFSKSLKEKIKRRVYVGRDERMAGVFSGSFVKSFIGDYYHQDIELYERVEKQQ